MNTKVETQVNFDPDIHKRVLKYRKELPNQNYVGIDNTYSGGYPYPTNAWNAYSFPSEKDALEYQKHFAAGISPIIFYISIKEDN